MMARKPYYLVGGMLIGLMFTGCRQTGPQNPFIGNNPSTFPSQGAQGWQQNSSGQPTPGAAQTANPSPIQGNAMPQGMPQSSTGTPTSNLPNHQGTIQQHSNFQSRLTTPHQPFSRAPATPNSQLRKPGTLIPSGSNTTPGQMPNSFSGNVQPIQPPSNTVRPSSYHGQPGQFPQHVQGYPNAPSSSNQLPSQIPGSRVQVNTLPGNDGGTPASPAASGSISNSQYRSQSSPYAYPGAERQNPSLPYINQ